MRRNVEAGKTETVEIRVAQGLLDRRMSGHAPETGWRAGGNRRVEPLPHQARPATKMLIADSVKIDQNP